VVPFPPGGSTDLIARTLSGKMAEKMGAGTFVVDNKPGATGTIGAAQVARAAPDGHTLLVASLGPFVIAPHLIKVSYDALKDLDPLTVVVQAPNVLVVPAASPHKSLADVIAFQKANPYKGGGPVMTDLLGNQVDASWMNINTAMPQIKSGKLRALAITSAKRSPLLPAVPTLEEGGVKDANVYSWQAVAAPKGLPADVKKRLHDNITAIIRDPQVAPKLLELGFELVLNTPEQFAAYQAAEYGRWQKLISSRDIKAD